MMEKLTEKTLICPFTGEHFTMPTVLTEEELREKYPAYREMMDYVNHKSSESGPILGQSPVTACIEALKKLDSSLIKLRKCIDKDKKVVNMADYKL